MLRSLPRRRFCSVPRMRSYSNVSDQEIPALRNPDCRLSSHSAQDSRHHSDRPAYISYFMRKRRPPESRSHQELLQAGFLTFAECSSRRSPAPPDEVRRSAVVEKNTSQGKILSVVPLASRLHFGAENPRRNRRWRESIQGRNITRDSAARQQSATALRKAG